MMERPIFRPIFLEGISEGKKIQAIKAIRAITGKSLKDAKEIADSIERGTARVIEPMGTMSTDNAIQMLQDHYVRVGERRDQQMFADEFIGQVIGIGVIDIITLMRGDHGYQYAFVAMSFLDGSSSAFSGMGKTIGYALRDVREKIREATGQ